MEMTAFSGKGKVVKYALVSPENSTEFEVVKLDGVSIKKFVGDMLGSDTKKEHIIISYGVERDFLHAHFKGDVAKTGNEFKENLCIFTDREGKGLSEDKLGSYKEFISGLMKGYDPKEVM